MKLLRVTAYCLQFINNTKAGANQRRAGSLLVKELNESLFVLVKNGAKYIFCIRNQHIRA